MRILTAIVMLALPALLDGIAVSAVATSDTPVSTRQAATTLDPADPKETMLLVSLDDGSVIMQTISSSADICFKSNTASSTTCLTRGAPLVDPASDAIIGFEMIEDQIDLFAKQD
mgnify:FL=1